MILLLTIFFLLIAIYLYSTRNYDYWAKQNVIHDPPLPFFGNHFLKQVGLKSIAQILDIMYKKYPKEKVVGYYRGVSPALVVRDLDVIKRILTADFPAFYIREIERDTNLEPLYKNLAHTDHENWKLLRQHWTPVFTTAKLRAMFPYLIRCAEKLEKMLTDLSSKGTTYNAHELMTRFHVKFISASGLGIDVDTINNEKSPIMDLINIIFAPNFRNRVTLALTEIFPGLQPYIRIDDYTIDREINNILGLIRKQRNGKPTGRRDFLDLMLETEAKGKIVGDSVVKTSDGTPAQTELEMDMECLAAQVFVFFSAGSKPAGLASSHTLHSLARYPEFQEKVQNEIDMVLSKYDGKLCYDSLKEMTLLDMAFKESLRILPPASTIRRICTQRCTIPELGITVDPGVIIYIPMQSIHMDEKYYDNPTEYRPERFSPDTMKKIPKFAYMPFGEGPRSCVGIRLAQMQCLASLAAILSKFTVELTKEKCIKLLPTHNALQAVEGGLAVTFKPRTQSKIN